MTKNLSERRKDNKAWAIGLKLQSSMRNCWLKDFCRLWSETASGNISRPIVPLWQQRKLSAFGFVFEQVAGKLKEKYAKFTFRWLLCKYNVLFSKYREWSLVGDFLWWRNKLFYKFLEKLVIFPDRIQTGNQKLNYSFKQISFREIAFTIFDKKDVTPLGLPFIRNTFKAIILLSLRDLEASMAGIIIGSIG